MATHEMIEAARERIDTTIAATSRHVAVVVGPGERDPSGVEVCRRRISDLDRLVREAIRLRKWREGERAVVLYPVGGTLAVPYVWTAGRFEVLS